MTYRIDDDGVWIQLRCALCREPLRMKVAEGGRAVARCERGCARQWPRRAVDVASRTLGVLPDIAAEVEGIER